MPAKKNVEIHVRILQNGHPVAECSKNLSDNFRLEISRDYTGDLAIPLYPLSENIQLFQRRNGRTILHLDQPWVGFATTSGQVRKFIGTEREAREFPLVVGDYGSLCLKDLRLMYRVSVKEPESKSDLRRAKGYGGIPFGLFLATEYERRFFAIAALMAFLILGVGYYTLLKVNGHRPTSLEELGTAYTLPFVSPDNIKLIPEALQTKFDRRNYLSSTIKYYSALSGILTGWFDAKGSKYLKQSTISRYGLLHEDFRSKIKSATEEQLERNSRDLRDRASGLVYIPSVLGESVNQRLARTLDKITMVREGLRLNLLFKRRISKQFGLDENYDWLNYHTSGNSNRGAQEYLSKVRVFSDLTNEQEMYATAENLAIEAKSLQQRKFGQQHTGQNSPAKEESYIQIDSGINFVSFIAAAQSLANDEKIGQIRASSFDRQRKEVIREPLVGEIDPGVIQKSLAKNQFQLQLCYELALRRNQLAQGSMDWQWRIDSRGKISEIILKQSSINDHSMVECVRSKMALWQFPRPRKGSIEVNHSFQFSPQKG